MPPLIATGLAVGLLSGTFGVGGGVIAVPALTLLLHIDQHIAQGTSLAMMVPTTALAAYRYWRAGHLRWPAAARLGTAALVFALLGAHVSLALPTRALRLIFAAFVAFLAVRIAVAGPGQARSTAGTAAARARPTASGGPRPYAEIGIGALAGLPSGLLGVGIGSIANPLLVLLGGFPQQLAQGTTLAAMTLSSLAGLSQYAAAGRVDWPAAAVVFVGAAIAVPAGAAIAHRLPEPTLRRAFTVFLIVIAALEVLHAV